MSNLAADVDNYSDITLYVKPGTKSFLAPVQVKTKN